MEKTTLHAAFVNLGGEIIRELSVPCTLYRHTDIPYIEFDDNLINEILRPFIPEEGKLNFYDKSNNKFNFTCSDIVLIEHELYVVPNRIDIDILVFETIEDDECIEHFILLEPGIWKTNKYGTPYRVCDDSRYHFALDVLVPKLMEVDNNSNHQTWKHNFFTAICELDMTLNNIFEEDDEDDDDDIDEFECDDVCEECINKHCLDNPNHVSKNVIDDEEDDEDDEIKCDGVCFACNDIKCNEYPVHKVKDDLWEDVDDPVMCDEDDDECLGCPNTKCECNPNNVSNDVCIDDCKNCTNTICINNPHHEKDCVNLKEWYSDRCAGYCDECTRKVCINGDVLTRNINKCDGCGHRKEC